jgi:hypothetical protein
VNARLLIGGVLVFVALFLGYEATDPGAGDPPCAFDGGGCSEEDLAGFDADGGLDLGQLGLAALIGGGGLVVLLGPAVRQMLTRSTSAETEDEP